MNDATTVILEQMQTENIQKIKRGNTSAGVNRAIIKYLLSRNQNCNEMKVLDLPCGDCSLLDSIKDFFPDSTTIGADIRPRSPEEIHDYYQVDCQRNLSIESSSKFDLVTCVSGVMEFDNTLEFFEQVKALMDSDGILIVSNDNLLTIRDRLLYLLFGRFRQYHLFISHDKPTWNLISLQPLVRVLHEAGFIIDDIKYVSPRPGEWIWAPFAVLFYVIQKLYIYFRENPGPHIQVSLFYPFLSFVSRHYILILKVRKDF